MCVLICIPFTVIRFIVIQSLNGWVKPTRGNTGFRKQRERTQLALSRLPSVAFETLDSVLDGHQQSRGDVDRVVASSHGVNGGFLAARLQSLQIPGQ